MLEVHFILEDENNSSRAVALTLAEEFPGGSWGQSSFQRPKYPTVTLVIDTDRAIEALEIATRHVRVAYELRQAEPPMMKIQISRPD